MKQRFWWLALTMFLVQSAFTQMYVVSTSPADGAVNVPTNATISFTFSEPIDTTKVDPESGIPLVFTIISPVDSTQLAGVSYSTDLKTVNFQVNLTANTDFVMILTYAKSTNGNVLERPYALNFTTASSHGQYTVSGNVLSDLGSVDGVMVILSNQPIFGDGGDTDNSVVSGTVVNASSPKKMVSVADTSGYQLNYVRPGTYWIAAAKDVNQDGYIDPESGDWLGMYDPDGDGEEDSIKVVNQNVSGIDIKMFKFNRYTVKQLVDSARKMAENFFEDSVKFMYLEAYTDSLVDGRDFGFMYYFHHPGYPFFIGVYYSDFWVELTDSVNWLPIDTTARPIPKNFIDSDSAAALAETNGGAAFRQRYVNFWVNYSLGNLKPILAQAQIGDTNKVVWVFYYQGYNANQDVYATHTVIIDAETGQVLSAVTGIEDVDERAVIADQFELAQNYPNPFNPSTTIEFTLPRAMEVQLAVFDALGRKVATLVNGKLEAGSHRVQFDARHLSAGVYFYSLKAGQMIKTRKMLLIK